MTDTTTQRRPRGRPRTTGGRTCDRCGRSAGKIRIRWPDGDICGICFHDATRTNGACDRCGQHRLLPGRDGNRKLCRHCAGITTDLDCHRCGAEGEHHRRGLCTRCTLRDDLTALLLPADGAATTEAARIVDVLATVDRPESIHTWKRNPKVGQLMRGLGDGTIPLTHGGFDAAPASTAREHLRELLGCDKHIARLRTLRRTNDVARLHQIHQAACLCKPHAEFALQHRRGSELRTDHKLYGRQEDV